MKPYFMQFFKCHLAMTLFWAAVSCYGQGDGGTIRATFATTDGIPLPGVIVVLTSEQGSTTKLSNAEGAVIFQALPPGMYQLIGRYEGFRTILRPDISLASGRQQAFEFEMESRSSEGFVVDIDETYVDYFPEEADTALDGFELQRVPIGSGPQPFLKFLPELAPQGFANSNGFANGPAWFDRRSWVVDELDIPENPATTPFLSHLDWPAFERIHFARLGNPDWRTFTGVDLARMGNSLLVNDFGNTAWVKTVQPGNELKGNLGLRLADSTSTVAGDATAPEGGDGVESLFHVGGPILKDRLWYWAGFRQNQVESFAPQSEAGRGKVENRDLKLSGFLGSRNTFHASYQDFANARLPSLGSVDGSISLQDGRTRLSRFSISQILGSNTELTLGYAGLKSENTHTPSPPNRLENPLQSPPGLFESGYQKRTDENVWDQLELKGLSFVTLGPFDQQIFFGLDHRNTEHANGEFLTDDLGFGLNPVIDTGSPRTFSAFRDGRTKSKIRSQNAWVEDFLIIDDFNVVLGFRMNQSEATNLSVDEGSPNPIFPEILPSGDSEERALTFRYRTFAPKLSVGYEVNRRWLDQIRVGYRKYFDRLEDGLATGFHPGRASGIVGYAQDLDGNGAIDADELGFATDGAGDVIPYFGNESAQNPYRFRPLGLSESQWREVRVDPDLNPPEIDEYQVRADWDFDDSLFFTASFSHLERSNEQRAFVQLAPGRFLDQSDFLPGYRLSGSHPETGAPWSADLGLISPQAASLLAQDGAVWIGNDPSVAKLNRFDVIGAWRDEKWSGQLHAVFSNYDRTESSQRVVLNEGFGANALYPSPGVWPAGEGADFAREPGSWGVSLVAIHQFTSRTSLAGTYSAKAFDLGSRFVATSGYLDENGVSADRWLSIDQPGQSREGVLSNVDFRFTHSLKLGRTFLDMAIEVFNLLDEQQVLVRDNVYGVQLDTGVEVQNFDEEGAGILNPNYDKAYLVTPPRRLRFSAVIRF